MMVYFKGQLIDQQRDWLFSEDHYLHCVQYVTEDGKHHELRIESEDDDPDLHHTTVKLDGVDVTGDCCILEYEINDKWLVVYSGTVYDHTSTTCLFNIQTGESRLLTNVGHGWNPSSVPDFTKNRYECRVDIEKETVYFEKHELEKSFVEIFQLPWKYVTTTAIERELDESKTSIAVSTS